MFLSHLQLQLEESVCVTHRSEPSAQRYKIGVVLQVEQLHQLNWGLTGGETPRLRQNLRSEREERDRGRVVRQEHVKVDLQHLW